MMHNHKAIPSKSRDRVWNHCVTHEKCAANPGAQSAHGNIIREDTCACGATRLSEINAGRTNYGPWSDAQEA